MIDNQKAADAGFRGLSKELARIHPVRRGGFELRLKDPGTVWQDGSSKEETWRIVRTD